MRQKSSLVEFNKYIGFTLMTEGECFKHFGLLVE